MQDIKKFVEDRLAEFTKEKENNLQMANRLEGACIAMRLILEELNKPEEEATDDKDSPQVS